MDARDKAPLGQHLLVLLLSVGGVCPNVTCGVLPAADLGTTAYVVPLLPVLACGVGFLILKAIEQPRNAIGCFLVFYLVAPNLNFRTRDIGDVQLDWQNGIKLAAWVVLFLVSIVRWRRIAPFLREPWSPSPSPMQ
jgi:hypothetical protein